MTMPPGVDASTQTLLVITFHPLDPISYSFNKRNSWASVAPGRDVSPPAGVEVFGVCRRAGGSHGAGPPVCSAGRMCTPRTRKTRNQLTEPPSMSNS